MAFALCFGKYAVFLFLLGLYAYIVLCHAAEHITAFADVNDGVVDLDTVNARMVVFRRKPLARQPRADIIFIGGLSQNSNSPAGIGSGSGGTTPKSYRKAPAMFSAATNTSG